MTETDSKGESLFFGSGSFPPPSPTGSIRAQVNRDARAEHRPVSGGRAERSCRGTRAGSRSETS